MIYSQNKIEFIIKDGSSSNSHEEIIHNKNSRRYKLNLTTSQYHETRIFWNLSSSKFRDDLGFEFYQYQSSRNKLNNGLLAETIVSLLNSTKIFGNYAAQKNDFLKIWLEYKHPIIHNKSRSYIGDFISFIYNEEWKINNGYDHTDFEYETLQEGEIILF